MGFFDFIKSQCLKVIEWTDSTSNTIASKFTIPDRFAIMKNSQLTVRESQLAVFVVDGKIGDIFTPGRYKLEDAKNIPIITKLMSWKYAWETPYMGEVYFINTKQFLNQKWGTTNPIMMEDSRFGVIRLRGYGAFGYKVNDPKTLIQEILGTKSVLKTEDILEHFKKTLVSRLSDAIAESGIPAIKLSAYYDELGGYAKAKISADFLNVGLELVNLIIENLSLPEEVEKTLDTKSTMNILADDNGGMGQFAQYQAAQAMRDAAKNSGGLAGAGMGVGAGVGIGQMFAGAFKDMNAPTVPAGGTKKVAEEEQICPKCGAELPKAAKFCISCGEKLGIKVCSVCGKAIKAGEKFCSECGAPVK